MNDFDNSRLRQDLNKKGNWLARRSVGQLVALFFAVIITLSIIGGIINFATSWFSTGAAIVSPANVKAQFANGYQDYETLKATASNYCDMKVTVNSETDPNIKAQRETQLLAFQQNYNRIKAEYDQAYENVFQGKLVKPSDLPAKAPSLQSMEKQVC